MASPARPAFRILTAGAALACTLAGAAACTSSGPPAPQTPTGGTHQGLTTAQAQAALLTDAEIGNGLSTSDLTPPDYPLPCTPNAKPLSKLVPPVAHATHTWSDKTDSIEITETINNYGDDATVEHALNLTEAGMSCDSGQIGSVAVSIGKPQDLSKNIKAAVDGIEAWAVTSSTSHETVILAKIDTQLVTMVFGVLPGLPRNAIDAARIVQNAMAKVTQATQ
jgi:hypothetical protein